MESKRGLILSLTDRMHKTVVSTLTLLVAVCTSAACKGRGKLLQQCFGLAFYGFPLPNLHISSQSLTRPLSPHPPGQTLPGDVKVRERGGHGRELGARWEAAGL